MAAQRGNKSALPTMHDLAEAIRTGETTHHETARAYGVAPKTIADRLRRAGFNATTGQREEYVTRSATLVEDTADLRWQEKAACVGHNPELWFADENQYRTAAKAVAICKACPARTQCLNWAIANGERYGIYGGVNMSKAKSPRAGQSAGPSLCKNGHERTKENVYERKDGKSGDCKVCTRERSAARRKESAA